MSQLRGLVGEDTHGTLEQYEKDIMAAMAAAAKDDPEEKAKAVEVCAEWVAWGREIRAC